jgi:hypothetical protein
MADEETKDGLKVSDKRRFKVDDSGKVVTRNEGAAEIPTAPAEPAPPPAETAPDKSTFQEECEPCRDEWSELPPIDFLSFIFSLSTSTMICLGMLPDPETQKEFRDLAMAKQNIDILAMLQEKTKGNVNREEEEFLTASLYDLRLRFVQACRKAPA